MNKNILILLIFQIFSFSFNQGTGAYLQISRSQSHSDQTGSLTPLVVKLSSDDKTEKTNIVDLICIVDISGSMGGSRINLVKESLKYLVKLMDSKDKLAIVTFTKTAAIKFPLTQMTDIGKNDAINAINSLKAGGGTNIYSGLEKALDLIKEAYNSENKVASMILLSDGFDGKKNADINFKNRINNVGKQNHVFSLHTLGYGESHDAVLMHKISLIRDGGYFFIRYLSDVNSAILEIYGSLSTTCKINVVLTISSTYKINKIMGMNEMYESNLINKSPYTFTTKILQFVYGKSYDFIALVDIPQNTQRGEVVLKARAKANSLDVEAQYTWDNTLDPFAYEEYIRGISFTFFEDAYKNGDTRGLTIMNKAIAWIGNYDGIRDWKKEYEDVVKDLKNLKTFGRANLLSKLRELKSCKLGIHYNDENSYQRKIMDDYFNIDVSSWNQANIKEDTSAKKETSYNYMYFYLTEGTGEIYGKHFSGNHSSFVLYSKDEETIDIKLTSPSMYYYYNKQNLNRLQTKIDFSTGGKFVFKKDFPFEFYTGIDGTKDVTFTIQFTKFEYEQIEGPDHLIEIKAYVLDSSQIEFLNQKPENAPSASYFNGYFDKGHRVGKIALRKEEIKAKLSLNNKNYLYIIVSKSTSSNVVYTNVEGQYTFVSMDYIYSFIPESFYIFSNLNQGQKSPHLYAIKLEPQLGKKTRIEFASSGNELDFAALKYKNNISISDDYYEDNKDFIIERSTSMGKTYLDITQANTIEQKNDYAIISIFSKNGGHIAGAEQAKLSYEIRYTTYSDYGIYTFNDKEETGGEVYIDRIESGNVSDINITMSNLVYKKNDDEDYVDDTTRFYMKLFPIVKKSQKIYESISLFESMTPLIYQEIDKAGHFNFSIDPESNYFLTTYTVSSKINEILSYKSLKIRRNKTTTNISDETSFGNEYEEEVKLDLEVFTNVTKKYLQIKVSDFKEGEFGLLTATLGGKEYKSLQPSNNFIVLPSSICKGQKIDIQVNTKDPTKTAYYLEAKLVDQIEINVGEEFNFKMLEDFNETIELEIKNKDQNKNKMNIFVQSSTGDIQINGISLQKSDIFGAQSINIENSGFISIKAKTGEYISVNNHIIDDTDKRIISNYQLSLYGYLQEKDCIYFDDEIANIKRYQVRILADKVISIKYNSSTDYEFTEPGVLYIKEFTEKLRKICLKQKDDLESIFFSMQIIDISDEKTTKAILHPAIPGNLYNDRLIKDEIRYYRQGLFEPNPNDELMYRYSVRQIEGEIEVYVGKCNNFPFCQYTKEDLLNKDKVKKLYNLDEYFTYARRAKDLTNYNLESFEVYLILCKSEVCDFHFIINKSNSIVNLTKLEKYSTKIYKNNIDKYSIEKRKENTKILSVSLYTHSGEVVLSSNDKCKNINHTIFGHLDRLEIPESCGIDHQFEIYVQANMDSVYSIEFEEIDNVDYSKIKSNIMHIETITNKKKTLEFTPVKNSFFVKFIPINCNIEVKYGIKDTTKPVPSEQNVFVYDSTCEDEKINKFEVTTEEDDCMIYTYLEELVDDFYSIISDQVPYYLSLNNKNKNYKLIYPITNPDYAPSFKINFFEETPIKISQSISNEKDQEIDAVFTKDIITNTNVLTKCDLNNICYLIIDIEKQKELANSIILELIPKSSNIIPGVLLDNKLKQDFVRINLEQKYMAKILKNEEGEIYFNYKYFSGELEGKLIKIDKTSWKNRYDLPKKDEYLAYDNLRQKIIFTKKETEKCDNGCYLFVDIHPNENYLTDEQNKLDKNLDYSIYLKKSEKTIQLKLNEVIIGTLSKTIEENYIEYYSIEVPYSTAKLYIDYSSENTNVVINSGNEKPTKDKHEFNFDSTGKDQIFPIKNESDPIIKGQKYIIGIYTNKLNNGVSQYSFRIRTEQNIIPNIIISDISTENICVTEEKNKKCYFLIPITHVQKNSNLFLYGISTSNSDDLIISYKEIELNSILINKDSYIAEDDDKYSKTSKDDFIKNMLYIKSTEMSLTENKNILIKIEAPEPGTVTLLHSFKTNLLETLLNPKNKEVFYMEPNHNLYLNIPQGVKSLVHINVVSGKGKLGYENDEQSIQEISGKYSSMYLQSTEKNVNRIIIKTDDKNNFMFYAYIKIGSIKRNINEIGLGSAVLRTGEGFPMEFYSKVSEDKDYVINFNLNKKYDLSVFDIKAYVVPEDIIEKLKLDDTYVYNSNPIKGKYEVGFSMAKLIINRDYIKQYYIKDKKNYIYLIIESSNNNPSKLNNIFGEITVLQDNNIDYIAPNNIYINSNLEKGKASVNKYKLIRKNSDDKIMRIEFSYSSENVKYKLYYTNTSSVNFLQETSIDYKEEKSLGKKNIDINLGDESNTIIFEIYNDNKDVDVSGLSYSLRYRTDKENNFKNYVTKEDIKIIDQKSEKENNKTKLSLSIPSIKDKTTPDTISAQYYLKVYNYSNKDIFVNGTISLVDKLEPYKIIEFKGKNDTYNQNLELSNDNNKYFLVVNAITDERELLSYNSVLIDLEKGDETDKPSDTTEPSGEKSTKSSGLPGWALALIIVLGVLLLLAIAFIIFRYVSKKKGNVIENEDQKLISLKD